MIEKQSEINCLTHQLDVEKLVSSRAKIQQDTQDLELKLEVLEDEEDQEATLKMEQETTESLRKRSNQLKEALKNNLDIKPWKDCQMCFQEFGVEGDMVPRFLRELFCV